MRLGEAARSHPRVRDTNQLGEGKAQEKVDRRDDEQHLEGLERPIHDVLPHACELKESQDVGERRVLQEADEEAHHRGDDDGQGLRQHDLPEDLGWAEPDGQPRLRLAVGDRADAAPEDLGKVSGGVDREPDDGGGERAERQPERARAQVDHQELDEQGRAADDVHHETQEEIRVPPPERAGGGDREAEGGARDERHERELERRERPPEKERQVGDDEGPVHG